MPSMRPIDEKLLEAVKKEKVTEVRALLEQGADPNSHDKWGSALIWAAYNNNFKILSLLVFKGADLNTRDANKWGTPIHWAFYNFNPEAIILLISKGAKYEKEKTGSQWFSDYSNCNFEILMERCEARTRTMVRHFLNLQKLEETKTLLEQYEVLKNLYASSLDIEKKFGRKVIPSHQCIGEMLNEAKLKIERKVEGESSVKLPIYFENPFGQSGLHNSPAPREMPVPKEGSEKSIRAKL